MHIKRTQPKSEKGEGRELSSFSFAIFVRNPWFCVFGGGEKQMFRRHNDGRTNGLADGTEGTSSDCVTMSLSNNQNLIRLVVNSDNSTFSPFIGRCSSR